jgi:hypothetical protein
VAERRGRRLGTTFRGNPLALNHLGMTSSPRHEQPYGLWAFRGYDDDALLRF